LDRVNTNGPNKVGLETHFLAKKTQVPYNFNGLRCILNTWKWANESVNDYGPKQTGQPAAVKWHRPGCTKINGPDHTGPNAIGLHCATSAPRWRHISSTLVPRQLHTGATSSPRWRHVRSREMPHGTCLSTRHVNL